MKQSKGGSSGMLLVHLEVNTDWEHHWRFWYPLWTQKSQASGCLWATANLWMMRSWKAHSQGWHVGDKERTSPLHGGWLALEDLLSDESGWGVLFRHRTDGLPLTKYWKRNASRPSWMDTNSGKSTHHSQISTCTFQFNTATPPECLAANNECC